MLLIWALAVLVTSRGAVAATPIANDDTVVVDSRYLVPGVGYVVVVDVLANDSEPAGEPLILSSTPTSVSGCAACAIVRLAEGVFRVEIPSPFPSSSLTFGYTLAGSGTARTATVTLTTSHVNISPPSTDPVEPIARDDIAFSAGSADEEPVVIDVLANDEHADDIRLASDPLTTSKGGVATVDRSVAPPVIRFTPNTGPGGGFKPIDHSGDTFDYVAINSDSGGEASATVTVAFEGKIIIDRFNALSDGTRPAPDLTPLAGQKPPIGGRQPNGDPRVWQTFGPPEQANALVFLDSEITTNTTEFAGNPAWLDFTPDDFSSPEFEVEASIDPGNGAWVAIGFARDGGFRNDRQEFGLRIFGTPPFNTGRVPGAVDLLGRSDSTTPGGVEVIASSHPGNWPAPDAYEFCLHGNLPGRECQEQIGPNRPSTLNVVKVRYEEVVAGKPLLSVWINGTRVFDRVPWKDGSDPQGPLHGLPPSQAVRTVGFQMVQATNTATSSAPPPGNLRLDDFIVRVGQRTGPRLTVASQPQDLTIPEGGLATFSEAVRDGTGDDRQLWWYKQFASSHAQSVEEKFGNFYVSGSRTPTFTIRDLSSRPAEGRYFAIVMDGTFERVVTEEARLTVDPPPVIQSMTVVGGACTTTSCICPGPACSFTASASDSGGGSVSYAWQFGDGATGQGPAPSHAYAGDGPYAVRLTVTDSLGQTATKTLSIRPDQPPLAVIASPIACIGGTCSFDGSGSTDGAGSIASYSWSFGDGSNAAGPAVQHAYAHGGTYAVTLTVTEQPLVAGTTPQQGSRTLDVLVDLLPIATISPIQCSGLTCTFDGSASMDPEDGAVRSYVWSFGDGSTGFEPMVAHAYAASGDYTVTLEVADSRGQVGRATAVAVADSYPTAAFTFSCDSLDCTFDPTASSDDRGIASYSWSFGDGATLRTTTAAAVGHSYDDDGEMVVGLSVTDTKGQVSHAQVTLALEDEELFLILVFDR